MELLYALLAGFILWKFNRPVTTLVKVFDTAAHIGDDSIATYANDVHISNAGKRVEQKQTIVEMGEVVTTDDINRLLAGKSIINKVSLEETTKTTH